MAWNFLILRHGCNGFAGDRKDFSGQGTVVVSLRTSHPTRDARHLPHRGRQERTDSCGFFTKFPCYFGKLVVYLFYDTMQTEGFYNIEEEVHMITWKNMDTLAAYQELQNTQPVDLVAAMSGEAGAERV